MATRVYPKHKDSQLTSYKKNGYKSDTTVINTNQKKWK